MWNNDTEFVFYPQHWTNTVEQSRFNLFVDATKRSDFTLCPRGYGAQSFRLYETLQLNSIPVIVYDKEWFPFNETIDWSSFCVLVHATELHSLKNKLKSINHEQKQQMLSKGREVYNKYFTLEGTSAQILKILQNDNKRI